MDRQPVFQAFHSLPGGVEIEQCDAALPGIRQIPFFRLVAGRQKEHSVNRQCYGRSFGRNHRSIIHRFAEQNFLAHHFFRLTGRIRFPDSRRREPRQ